MFHTILFYTVARFEGQPILSFVTRPDEMEQLWLDYRKAGDQDARDRLTRAYVPLLKYVAGRLASGLSGFDEGDLFSYGLSGLVEAVDQYDPAQDVTFDVYAMERIKGQIVDELRSRDWRPDSLDEPDADGGVGVREPRRPEPPDSSDAVAVPRPESEEAA